MTTSISDTLSTLRRREEVADDLGVIVGDGVRWTDGLWTYDVRLESTGRLLRRVRESQPRFYQSGSGLYHAGDRVVIRRLSRTRWEIVGDAPTPANWGIGAPSDGGFSGPSVVLEDYQRLPYVPDVPGRQERVRSSWIELIPTALWMRGATHIARAGGRELRAVDLTALEGIGRLIARRADAGDSPPRPPDATGLTVADGLVDEARLRYRHRDGAHTDVLLDGDGVTIETPGGSISIAPDGMTLSIVDADGQRIAGLSMSTSGVDVEVEGGHHLSMGAASSELGKDGSPTRFAATLSGPLPASLPATPVTRQIIAVSDGPSGALDSHTHRVTVDTVQSIDVDISALGIEAARDVLIASDDSA